MTLGLAARPLPRTRAQSYPHGLPVALAGVAIVLFLALSLWRLDALPPVYEDEPWQASVAYKLVRHGVFGSDMFAGWNGMQDHYYGFMPLHPLLLAGVFGVLGEGLVQARLEAVGASTATLILTFVLGRRLFGDWVAALALGLLLLVRWTGTTTVQLTGIAFVDLARIARYDVVVPVFGLGSLLAYLWARDHAPSETSAGNGEPGPGGQAAGRGQLGGPSAWRSGLADVLGGRAWRYGLAGLLGGLGGWRYGLAGLLAGLAGLAHLYGLFWVAVLCVLVVWDGARIGRRRALGWLAVGAALPWLPYLLYVLSDLEDWRAQVRGYADRFGLLDPRWYLRNLVEEPRRYGPGLGPFGLGWLARPGWWSMLVIVPTSVVWLVSRAWRHGDRSARAIAGPAIVLPLLFGLLLRLKLVNYTLTLLPVLAIAAAWGLVQAIGWLSQRRDGQASLSSSSTLGRDQPPGQRSHPDLISSAKLSTERDAVSWGLSIEAGVDSARREIEDPFRLITPPTTAASGGSRWNRRAEVTSGGVGAAGRTPPSAPVGLATAHAVVEWWRRGLVVLVGLLAVGVAIEGAARLAGFAATPATPYPLFIARVHRAIPAGARVVGLHNYWFGLEDTDYRSFVVPLSWMDADHRPAPVPFDAGLDALAPEVVLLDDRMRVYLSYVPDARARFEAWLAARDATLVDQIADPTYGLMEIYAVRPAAQGRTLNGPPA